MLEHKYHAILNTKIQHDYQQNQFIYTNAELI